MRRDAGGGRSCNGAVTLPLLQGFPLATTSMEKLDDGR